MAYGYENGFVIDYNDTVRRKLDCRDCCHYLSDKSCLKRPLYLPEDGYNSWKNCAYFEMRKDTNFYTEKKAYYEYLTNSGRIRIKKPQINKKAVLPKKDDSAMPRPKELEGYSLILSPGNMIPFSCDKSEF